MDRGTFLALTGAAAATISASHSAGATDLLAALSVEVVALDRVTLTVRELFSIPNANVATHPAIVGRYGNDLYLAQVEYAETGWRCGVFAFRDGRSPLRRLTFEGDGKCVLLPGGRVAYIRYTDDRVEFRELRGNGRPRSIALASPTSVVKFGAALAVGSGRGIGLYDGASLVRRRMVPLEGVTLLAARGDRLIAVHGFGGHVTEFTHALRVRQTFAFDRRVGALAAYGEDQLVIGNSECDVSRGETVLYDMRTGTAVWRSETTMTPVGIVNHGDSLVVGDASCGPENGVLRVLALADGRSRGDVTLPGTGLHQLVG